MRNSAGGIGSGPASGRRLHGVPLNTSRACVASFAVALTALAAGCSSGNGDRSNDRSDTFDPKWGVSSSPRLASEMGPIPKGGGAYKVGDPYQVAGTWYYPRHEPGYDMAGVASWYGPGFHARKTSNGEVFDMNALTAAHKTLPLPSYAYVTNLNNGRTILVRINDRGPYVNDRLIDLSKASADALGYGGKGLVEVRVRYAGEAPINGNDNRERNYLAAQPWATWNPNIAEAARGRPDVPFVPAPQPISRQAWSPFSHRAGLGVAR